MLFGLTLISTLIPKKLFRLMLLIGIFYQPVKVFAQSESSCITPLKTPIVSLIIPDYKNSFFWSYLVKIAISSSKQLNINLRIHYIDDAFRSSFNYAQIIDQILLEEERTKGKPDYVVSYFLGHTQKKVLDVLAKHQIKLFSYNSPIPADISNIISLPRERYKNWIGHISPDEINSGYQLADTLIKQHKTLVKTLKPLRLLAITGSRDSSVAQMRVQGLQQRINESSEIKLLQVLYTNWTYQQVKKRGGMLLNRFNNIDIIWSASDLMAIAMLDNVKNSKNILEHSITLGGIDWMKKTIPYLKNNEIDVSYGGHFFEPAWVLGLIYDHFNGLDFKKDTGVVIKYNLSPVFAENAELLNIDNVDNINFKIMSKCLTPNTQHYQFNAMKLLTSQNEK